MSTSSSPSNPPPENRASGDRGRAAPELDETDRQLLTLLAEHRAVAAPQISAWLKCSDQAAAARLERLNHAKLILADAPNTGQPEVVTIRGAGLRALGLRCREPQLNHQEYRHDVGLAWLWISAHQGGFGPLRNVISEKAMRSADHRFDRSSEVKRYLSGEKPFGIRHGATTPTGRERRHYPDLLLETPSGHRIAVELELTAKAPDRLRQIMSAYGNDDRIKSVLYIVPTAALAKRIRSAARDAGVSDLVQIRPLMSTPRSAASGTDRAVEHRRSAGKLPDQLGPGHNVRSRRRDRGKEAQR